MIIKLQRPRKIHTLILIFFHLHYQIRSKLPLFISIDPFLKQGCVLSPTLFSVLMYYLVNMLDGVGIGIDVGKQLINCLLFADDIALLQRPREIHTQILIFVHLLYQIRSELPLFRSIDPFSNN
jgi:hypothetical protein